MIRDRETARQIADKMGYFWLPCKLCGEYFAGFEAGDAGLPIDWNKYESVCSKEECVEFTKCVIHVQVRLGAWLMQQRYPRFKFQDHETRPLWLSSSCMSCGGDSQILSELIPFYSSLGPVYWRVGEESLVRCAKCYCLGACVFDQFGLRIKWQDDPCAKCYREYDHES
jgi:hypothetical protein